MKTITEVREAFWAAYPAFAPEFRVKKRQNDYRVDIRCAFCEFTDHLHRDGQISDALAQRVTL